MDALAKDALESVESGKVKLIPDKYRNTYKHWMENVRDWCISRQLWWGQRIPAWYLPDGRYVVENDAQAALKAAQALEPSVKAEDLHQDEDVLDTWFSSWLWPISVFDTQKAGHPDREGNADLQYYYPTNDLVTGPDILFFWVARMIMAGNEFMHDVPFRNVYLTGIVRDKLGRKMSKTLGNSPDPLELIEKYGADSVRLGMLLCSSAGNDILYDEAMIEQGRNFCAKIWNAYRLIKGWESDPDKAQPEAASTAIRWFDNKLAQTIATVDDHFSKFRISDALMSVYKLFWDDFCGWLLEAVKPAFGEKMDAKTLQATRAFLEALLKMIHPIMPFITEELWQDMEPRKDGETIMLQPYPRAKACDEGWIADFDMAVAAVSGIRALRQEKGISPKESLKVQLDAFPARVLPIVVKLANAEIVSAVDGAGSSFMAGTSKVSVLLEGFVNNDEEKSKLTAELQRLEGFLTGVRKKLSNEKFVAGAPEQVVALERKKEADALAKIEAIRQALQKL